MTLRDLVLAAGGTRPDVLPTRAHIERQQEDLSRTMIRYELNPDSSGVPTTTVPIEPDDRVRLYTKSQLLLPPQVAIFGAVKDAGTYDVAEGMTVEDLILRASGFEKGARAFEVEVARLRDGRTRSDTISITIRVTLRPDSMLDVPAGPENGDDGEDVERTKGSTGGTSYRGRSRY